MTGFFLYPNSNIGMVHRQIVLIVFLGLEKRKIIFSSLFIILIIMVSSANFTYAGNAFDTSVDMVRDMTGRSVKIPKNPNRIVALAPSITEIIYMLNCQDRLKGVTIYSDYPEAAKKLPKIGSYINPDLEKIVSLEPDLCIAIKDGNPKKAVLRLEEIGVPVFAVDPSGLESVIETVRVIGELLNVCEKADEIIQKMRYRMKHVESVVSKSDHRPRVFFQIGVSPIVSPGVDTFIHELIMSAGGTNIAEQYTSYPRFSKEEILILAPEIIIITTMARGEKANNVKSQWQKWVHIPAVKNDKIYIVDSNKFDRPTPRLIDGLEILAGLIHPELFQK